MPGIPQGRDIGESGPKSVSLVSVMDDGSIVLDERIVSIAQFERVSVGVAGAASWTDLATRIDAAIGEATDKSASEHVVARLAFSGTTPLAWNIRRDADLLRTEVESRAEAIGNVWIEKLEIDCRPPKALDAVESAAPLDVLRRTVSEETAVSESFRAEADGIVSDLFAQLPPECRCALAPDDRGLALLVERLVAEGSEEVLARLAAGSAEGGR
jgi:DNA repair protein SbcD/Mre11